MTTARFVIIQELTNLYYLGAMMDHQTAKFLLKTPSAKNPRALSRLFAYRSPVTAMILKYLAILGLDRLPTLQRSLEEILNEDDEQPNGEADAV